MRITSLLVGIPLAFLAASGCAQEVKVDPMVRVMGAAAKEICACKNVACADAADRAAAEKARPWMADKSYKPTAELRAQASALIAEGRACKDKLRSAEPATP